MKILFLSRWFPFPVNNGSKLRIYNLLRGLAQHHDVTLLSFTDQPNEKLDVPEIRAVCSQVHVVPWREFNPHSWRARLGFVSLKPRSIIDTFSAEMAVKITMLLQKCEYDLVIASQISMAAYRPYFKNVPAMFEEVEIGLNFEEGPGPSNLKKQIRHAFTWFKLRSYLLRVLASFQVCTVVSEQERQYLINSFPSQVNKINVIPNCVQVDSYNSHQSIPVPGRLIFSGSFRYRVNYEAMLWFVREVFPYILDKVPRAHLIITGDHANLPFPSGPHVTLTGYVDDIKTMIASSWVSVAPLLHGGGTRLKILEAMSIGTPVVSTSKGAEGLDASIGDDILVSDDPQAFAVSVVEILENKDLRDKIAANAYKLVKEKYDWEATLPRFLCLVENTVSHE